MRGARARAAAAPVLLAAALLLAAAAPAGAPAAGADQAAEEFDDEDSDSAPFMIVVEHPYPGRFRCAGSLVSLRTGVTSAGCARGRGAAAAGELWALAGAAAAGVAPRAAGARRVVRVAAAGAAGGGGGEAQAPPWAGAVLDLAVLELEAPFGSAALARPIFMATAAGECGAAGAACHVVRALPRPPSRRALLRIVDARLAPGAACAALARYWAAVRDQALCVAGPELCASDWGAGVVCGGKLCGVVSRSARAATAAGAPATAAGDQCGDTHAAQSVARWRRFLHCAHTLRACGRGECAEVCTERRLVDAEVAGVAADGGPELRDDYGDARLELRLPRPGAASLGDHTPRHTTGYTRPPPPRTPPAAPGACSSLGAARPSGGAAGPPRPRVPTRTPPPSPAAATAAAAPSPVRPPPLFEPNRPDFHAGEYDDNAAEYGAGADEGAAPPPTLAASAGAGARAEVSPRLRVPAARRVAPAALPARHAPAAPAPAAPAARAAAPTPHLALAVMLFILL